MRKYIFAAICLFFGAAAGAQELKEYMTDPLGVSLSLEGSNLDVSVDLNIEELLVKNNTLVTLTPVLINGEDSTCLSTVGFYGRRRWFWYQRNEDRVPDAFKEFSVREKDIPQTWSWKESLPFEEWMNGSTLALRRQVYGCCNEVRYEDMVDLGHFVQYIPKFIFITPEYETVKSRHVEGRAYVDFPLSKTVIYPDYRDNQREIGKILASIDTLKRDSDIEIKSLSIKGFASPEGPYDNNTRLAKGRTEALKTYVSNLYSFSDNFITTSFESENWEGLREFVASSSVPHKAEILDIIDHSQRDPDTKEWLIKSRYPEDYAFIYKSCYAGLRRSDYFIDYTIRNYTDVDEIESVFFKSPGKLSLYELFTLSSKYEPGSPEFEKVFDVAVTLYPDNEIANINAAASALKAGRLAKAEEYLLKAGDSAHTDYLWAILKWLSGDRYAALRFFEKAQEAGIPEAGDAIAKINASSR